MFDQATLAAAYDKRTDNIKPDRSEYEAAKVCGWAPPQRLSVRSAHLPPFLFPPEGLLHQRRPWVCARGAVRGGSGWVGPARPHPN